VRKKIKNLFNLALFSPVLFFYCAGAVFGAEAPDLDIKAERLVYHDAESYIIATGSVTVTWDGKLLTADKIEFYIDRDFMLATGSVTVSENTGALYGEALAYDLKSKKGEFTKARGSFPPWRFSSQKLVRHNEESNSLSNGIFTNCDLDKPHYYIYSTKANIKPNKRITLYNCIFLWNSIPMFYFPVFTQGIGPHRDSIEIQPGFNNEDGIILKIIYGYKLTDFSYAKLYIDYFSRRGLGKGIEYNYDVPDKLKGTFYGYHIKETTYQKDALTNLETSTQKERWNMRSYYWHRLDLAWTGQAELNFNSDKTFNNQYFQENWDRTTQDLRSNLSFTRQNGRSNLRFTVERTDTFNPALGVFQPSVITAPKVEYTLFPLTRKKGIPFYTNFSGYIQNQYINTNDFYLVTAFADSNIFKDYRITRNLIFTPKLGLNETWQNRASILDYSQQLTSRYYADLGLRYRPVYWMDWDLLYSYKLRSVVNSPQVDSEAADYGEELKQVYFQNSIYANKLVLRNSTIYNFHLNRNEILEDWKLKFSPLVNELSWLPNPALYAYLREESNIYPHYLNSVQGELRLGRMDAESSSLGAFYHSSRPEELDLNVGLSFWPTSKWRINYIFRTTAAENFKKFTTNDEEIRIYRDIHCWEFKVIYRRRQAFEEVYLQVDLKTSATNRKNVYDKEKEKEFYPWRDGK